MPIALRFRVTGHDWSETHNHHLGQRCHACGLTMRWHREAGHKGLVRQVGIGPDWVTEERERPCIHRSRWSRDQSRG